MIILHYNHKTTLLICKSMLPEQLADQRQPLLIESHTCLSNFQSCEWKNHSNWNLQFMLNFRGIWKLDLQNLWSDGDVVLSKVKTKPLIFILTPSILGGRVGFHTLFTRWRSHGDAL